MKCSQALHKQVVTAHVAQHQMQLRAFLVAILDNGDLAAAKAEGVGNLMAAAASLLAAVWSALAAAAAATAADVSTSNVACYSLARISSKVPGRRGSTKGADSRQCQLWQLMLYLM